MVRLHSMVLPHNPKFRQNTPDRHTTAKINPHGECHAALEMVDDISGLTWICLYKTHLYSSVASCIYMIHSVTLKLLRTTRSHEHEPEECSVGRCLALLGWEGSMETLNGLASATTVS